MVLATPELNLLQFNNIELGSCSLLPYSLPKLAKTEGYDADQMVNQISELIMESKLTEVQIQLQSQLHSLLTAFPTLIKFNLLPKLWVYSYYNNGI